MVDVIASDARAEIPADEQEVAELYESQVVNNPSFRNKGPYVKMCSWFSILAAIEYHDWSWTSLRHVMTWYGDSTESMTKGAVERRAAVEQQISRDIVGIDAASRVLPAAARLGPEDGVQDGGTDQGPEAKNKKMSEKETHKDMMTKLRAAAGSALALAPRLMNDNNLVNMRIILLAGRLLWSEQSKLASDKTTAAHQRHRLARQHTASTAGA